MTAPCPTIPEVVSQHDPETAFHGISIQTTSFTADLHLAERDPRDPSPDERVDIVWNRRAGPGRSLVWI